MAAVFSHRYTRPMGGATGYTPNFLPVALRLRSVQNAFAHAAEHISEAGLARNGFAPPSSWRDLMTFDAALLEQSVNRIGPWADLPFFSNGQFARVCARLESENWPVWPAPGDVLRAYEFVPPCAVRVVVLGQDPYPQPGRATGLAFAVPNGQTPPRGSLPNIFEELRSDPRIPRMTTRDPAANSELTGWARQGVLLLNTILTVPEDQPGGHGSIGWSPLLSQTLRLLAPRPDIAWLLCGYRAKRRVGRMCLHGGVIATGHPSRKRRSVVRHPFSEINACLQGAPIDWWRT